MITHPAASGRRFKRLRLHRFLISFLVLISFFMATYSFGEEKSKLNLNDLVNEALKNNPELKAYYKRYEAARERTRLLRTLNDPKFEFEYDKITADMRAVMEGKTGPMRTFSLSQEIPFPTKLILRTRSSGLEAKSFEEDYKEKRNELIRKVKESYYRISLNNREIQIKEDTKILFDQLIKTLTNRYSLGKATQQEVLKAQTEYSRLDNDVILLREEKRINQSMLKMLLGRPQGDELLEPPLKLEPRNFKVDKSKLYGLLEENRPELLSGRAMVKKAKVDRALSFQEYFPDIMLKYKREENKGGLGTWAGMIGVTFPLWFFDKQDSFVKEAKANLEEAKSQYAGLENVVSYELEAALATLDAKAELAELYKTSFLPQGEAAFDSASIGFEAGRNSFLDFLDSERMLLDFKLEYAKALAELEISYAELERVVGTQLGNISVE